MLLKRVIPCLLLKNKGLVKTVNFKNPTYIGDPINAVKIFNEKEVDELIFLNIDATLNNLPPPYELIKDISSECFMPFCYGGGIKNIDQIGKIINSGAEKISINSEAFYNPKFVEEAVKLFGSSTIVASVDIKKNIFGKNQCYINGGRKNTKLEPSKYIKRLEELGVGEIILNSIDKDGTMQGYDIALINKISNLVNIPVIAIGGAGNLSHVEEVLKRGNASAAAAGSIFVFHGKHKAVLISYPDHKTIKALTST